MSRLDLIAPGLLGPFPADTPDYIHRELQRPVFTPLNKMLSRAVVSDVFAQDFYTTLQQLICPQCELSLCEISAAYSDAEKTSAVRYRIDPVHFKAESDHAILLGPELLEVVEEESRQLVEAFNDHFAEDEVSLSVDSAGHWYLHYIRPLQLAFTPLDEALGRDIKHFMPTGEDALWWRRIVNEAQMLFFQHAVNQQRESNGQLSINGLWIWDRQLETEGETPSYQQLFADNLLASCMAAQSSLRVQPLEVFSAEKVQQADQVMVVDSLYPSMCYGDTSAWIEALEAFCNDPFKNIVSLMNKSVITQLNIYSCDGRCFTITKAQAYKFWKPVKTAEQFFSLAE